MSTIEALGQARLAEVEAGERLPGAIERVRGHLGVVATRLITEWESFRERRSFGKDIVLDEDVVIINGLDDERRGHFLSAAARYKRREVWGGELTFFSATLNEMGEEALEQASERSGSGGSSDVLLGDLLEPVAEAGDVSHPDVVVVMLFGSHFSGNRRRALKDIRKQAAKDFELQQAA
jgi:hypothetical protein